MAKFTYSIKETAKILGISSSLAYVLVNNGTIPSIKLGAKRRISRQALSQILDENPLALNLNDKNEN